MKATTKTTIKESIYRSGIAGEPDADKPRMRTSIHIDQICVSGNFKKTPGQIRKWLTESQEKAMQAGWENLRIETEQYTTEFNAGSSYICLIGDRMETDNEVQQRVGHLISDWQREYENYLRSKRFYESETGQARIAEVIKLSKRPINYAS